MKKAIEILNIKLLQQLFPSELMEYFEITSFETLCSVALKEEYWLLDFEEKNQIPTGYKVRDYESIGFMESKLIQNFPLRGKAVYLFSIAS